jgi:outer membrane murein-binding lipoprotein Lpp
MTKPKKPRNRAAQDATLVNIRALKARVAQLERKVKALEKRKAR